MRKVELAGIPVSLKVLNGDLSEMILDGRSRPLVSLDKLQQENLECGPNSGSIGDGAMLDELRLTRHIMFPNLGS